MRPHDSTRETVLFTIVLGLLVPLVLVAPTGSRSRADFSCVISETGDLKTLVETIVSDHTPGPDSNGMIVPAAAQKAAWETVLAALAHGDVAAACTTLQANGFPYHIIHFADTGASREVVWVLREDWPISVGWGTYVVRDTGLAREIVIEVPHPQLEVHTDVEGVDLFRQLNARALSIAGTHRCANMAYSACSETTTICGQEEPYRTSDAAHTAETMFQAAHRALVPRGTDRLAVQLHGCTGADCPDLFISNGTCTPGELSRRLLAKAQDACGDRFAVDVADCGAGECPLVGTINAQGRYSNGCDQDPCGGCPYPPGPPSPEQFIHLEQQHDLRDDYSCLVTALKRTFPYRLYTPTQIRKSPAAAPASIIPPAAVCSPTRPAVPARGVFIAD